MINVKVSGITSLKQLKQLDGLDIEFASFNFDPASPWYVGNTLSGKEVKAADYDIKKVGVFVNADYDEIVKIIDDYTLDVVQLNGDETPLLCEQLSDKIEVIKTIAIGNTKESLDELIADYDEVCDYYLFTGVSKAGQPEDVKFDWKKLNKSKIEKPFFLSGGIGPDDAAKLKTLKHLDFYGVDINSQFEKEAGEKDMVAVLQFKKSLRS